jgi:hypothetical protein
MTTRAKRITTLGQAVWQFLQAVGEIRAREEMLAVAHSIAPSRPELAARLRRAARESWAGA